MHYANPRYPSSYKLTLNLKIETETEQAKAWHQEIKPFNKGLRYVCENTNLLTKGQCLLMI